MKPGDGAVLTSGPATVEIEMSQELGRREGANDIDVFDAAGTEVTTIAAVIDDGNRRKLSVSLPSGLKPGKYLVRWKSLSADDGDSASGQLSFTVDPAAAPTAGKEILREDLLAGTPEIGPSGTLPSVGAETGGRTSWVLVAAVAVAMFVLGGGVAFLLIQRKP